MSKHNLKKKTEFLIKMSDVITTGKSDSFSNIFEKLIENIFSDEHFSCF